MGMSRLVTSRKSTCVIKLQAQLSGVFFLFFFSFVMEQHLYFKEQWMENCDYSDCRYLSSIFLKMNQGKKNN